jgi:hypothetical protein
MLFSEAVEHLLHSNPIAATEEVPVVDRPWRDVGADEPCAERRTAAGDRQPTRQCQRALKKVPSGNARSP